MTHMDREIEQRGHTVPKSRDEIDDAFELFGAFNKFTASGLFF